MKDTNPIQPATLGYVARQYRMRYKTLRTLIDANVELKAEIERYTRGVQRKASKLLPPITIENIYKALGKP